MKASIAIHWRYLEEISLHGYVRFSWIFLLLLR
jgi:hypothetical protein